MTYRQTLDYLYAQLPMYHRIGAQAYKANLDNTVALCDMLDNPQRAFRSIHITGTNGKGSVSHMVASILQSAGLRTGLYTSPHLKDFRERIKINGKMIPKGYVTEFITRYRHQFEPIKPSFFELTVGMAFDYFRDQQVDIAVVEVGLGGRLDSTNVITPLLSVITNVSFDHMQFLGKTRKNIATEKAGIIKPGIPVLIGETQKDVKPVFQQKAAACNSAIVYADQQFTCNKFELTGQYSNRRSIDISHCGAPFIKGMISPLAGIYQRKNILTVMGICELLNMQGIKLTPPLIRAGIRDVIKNTGLAGRWQILAKNPLTICDTGHNEGGLREVLAQIAAMPYNHLHFVFGVVNDKHLPPLLKMLPSDATYYYCKPAIPRGLDAVRLQQQAMVAGLHGSAYPSVTAAFNAAQMNATDKDLVFVGGSTFVVAEVV